MLKTQNLLQSPETALATASFNVAEISNNADAKNKEQAGTEPLKYLWIRAPKSVVYSRTFSDSAKLLYLILLDYQGRNSYAFPSLETLAANSGKSVRRVQQILKELEVGGAIEIISQPGWVNLYRVCTPPNDNITKYDAVYCEDSEDKNKVTVSEDAAVVLENTSSNLTQAQVIAPTQDIAPLPLQNIAIELDASELELNFVCEKSRTQLYTQRHFGKSSHAQRETTSKPLDVSQPQTKLHLNPRQFSIQPILSDTQAEIAQLLRNAGVAGVDAERIALTNPAKAAVTQWIDFAMSKANPGGYLAVVLGKKENLPPPRLAATQTPQSGNQMARSNWRGTKPSSRTSHEAGALAYMRRHQTELENWQYDQPDVREPENHLSDNAEKSPEPAESPVYADVELADMPKESRHSNGNNADQAAATGGASIEAATLENSQPRNQATETTQPETSEPALVATIDPQIRSLIRQLDRQACQYLKQAHIENDKLVVSFVGNYCPTQNPNNWLPTLKLHYTMISEVLLL